MHAAIYTRTGPAADVLSVAERPRPEPGDGEVRVRLAWSGVNPSDTKSRAGLRSRNLPFAEIIPHSDGAGVIDALGPGVDAMRLGQRVWIWNGAWQRPFGTAAQWIVVPETQAVVLPDAVPLEIGACLGIPALTACHAVHTAGGVAGKTVLVAGGAGAVGHYAVQMARLAGAAEVIATVSSEAKAALATAAGAHHVVNYRQGDPAAAMAAITAGRGVDRIIEVDLHANLALDFNVLASDGEIVVYGSGQAEVPLPFVAAILKNVRLQFFIVYHLNPQDRAVAQAHLHRWLAHGALTHNIAHRLSLHAIVQAHELVESGRSTGNVVLDCA